MRLDHGLLCVTLVLCTAGCQFKKLERSLDRIEEELATLELDFTSTGSGSPNIVVAADTDLTTNERMRVRVVYESTVIQWKLVPGEYYLGAYEDTNGNMRRDDGEPMRFWGDAAPLVLEAGKTRSESLAVRPGDVEPTPRARELIAEARRTRPKPAVPRIGDVAALNDPRFERENADKGSWDPHAFLAEGLHGLYMLEAYDPDRIPLVLVHGAGGTPRDFTPIVEALDASRYQAWVFYYPTSLDLDDVAGYLAEAVGVLTTRLGVGPYGMVAHSMGGLVARAAANRLVSSENRSDLRVLVTMSSPLGGVDSAKSGTKWAPEPMPCWYDLSPGSPFLRELFETTLAPQAAHHIVFAYRRSGPGGESSDGTIALKSQLRVEAQAQAKSLFGVDADHVGVLSSPLVHEHLAEVLAQHLGG